MSNEKQPTNQHRGISMEFSEQLARKYGFLPAPKDHPIYSEGTTISFVSPNRYRIHSDTDARKKGDR